MDPMGMGCHPSHWRPHIFQDGYCTTNQASMWMPFALLASQVWCQAWERLQLELLWVQPHVPELRHNWPPPRSASWEIKPSEMADVCWSGKALWATACSVVWMWAWWQPTLQTWVLPSTRPWMWTSAKRAPSVHHWTWSRASKSHFAPSTLVVLWPTSVRLWPSSISSCFTARTKSCKLRFLLPGMHDN